MKKRHLNRAQIKTTLSLFLIMSIFTSSAMALSPSQIERQKRIAASPQWIGDKFENIEPVGNPSLGEFGTMMKDWIFKKPSDASADPALPVEKLDLATWPQDTELQFSWLGHTTFLLNIEGKWIITDPIFSKKAGSFGFLSPSRYSPAPLGVEQLPEMDVVLITHNHYDHLDEVSIKALIPKTKKFIAPLSVGDTLEEWGVPVEKIVELDWWEEVKIDQITLTAAPARHFASRGLFDRNEQLWASYAIKGEKNNIYLSGDSGWHKELYEIGERLGPFDLTFFEMGAYGDSTGWKELHYTPEEAVKAHQAVGGKLLVPSHWATFDLAMFSWHEPIERFVVAGDEAKVNYLTPKIGERVNPSHVGGKEKWWRDSMAKGEKE